MAGNARGKQAVETAHVRASSRPYSTKTVIGKDLPVRVRHITSGQYLALRETVRIHSFDDTPPALAMSWGPKCEASVMMASTARAVACAWICVADDASVEIEEVAL
jgi:hypothetical protein